MKYFSAFTGVGGFDMGMPPDWECVGHSEIDKYANMVLKYRFEDVKNYGNAEKIDWKEIPDFDLLAGGTPCQDLSISGKRAGLTGSRSRLFFEFARALREKRPRYFIWENVAGALSSNGGWDFARVLLEFSEAGYSVWWQVLDAAWFGIPQHRERVFVVGSLGDEPPLKILFEPAHAGSLAGAQKIETIHRSRRQTKRIYGINGVAPTLQMSIGGYHDVKIAIPVLTPNRMEKRQNGRRFKENGESAFTLTRQDGHGIFDGKTIRTLTPLECERLMGWPDNWTRYGIDAEGNTVELSDPQRYNMTGNGVVPQVVSAVLKNMVIANEGTE
jgi:DNA (cytosine-5)-methyltransferase 1